MKKNLIFCFALLLISAVSCTDRLSFQEEEEYIDFYITACLDTNETRTSLFEASADTAYVRWSDNDSLFLYCQDKKWSSSKPTDITNNGRTAKFSFKITKTDSYTIQNEDSYLFYGNQSISVNNDGKPVSITVPAEQRYAGTNGFCDGENASFAVVDHSKIVISSDRQSAGVTCTMNNAFGILKINVELDDSKKSIQSVNVSDLANNVYLAGKFTIEFKGGKPVIEFASSSTGVDAVPTLTKKVYENINSGIFYFLIPPGNLSTGFKVSVYTNDGYYGGKTITSTSAKTQMERSKIIEVTLNKFKPKNKYPKPADQATANCYIVPAEAGPYSIPADYKGNGYQGNNTRYVEPTSTSITEAFSAGIIWQSKLNADVLVGGAIISNVCLCDTTINGKTKHYIGFTRTGVPGNALVAVKDKDGTILWSWHLWITSETIKVVDSLMDRNLGALSDNKSAATQTHGCAYQYGRKDPFLGSGYPTIASDPLASGQQTHFASLYPSNAVSCYQPIKVTEEFTFAKSVKQPNVRSILNNEWCSETSESWERITWSYKDEKGKYEKSLCDPCPAGWRVATQPNINKLMNSVVVYGGLSEQYGNYCTIDEVYFPTAGYSNQSTGVAGVGNYVYLWSADYIIGSSQRPMGTCFSITISKIDGYSSVKRGLIDLGTHYTMPVRCEKYTEPALPSSN